MYKASIYNILIKKENNRCLVYNTNNQALCWIPDSIYEQFSKSTLDIVNSEEILKEYGYIVDSCVDEFSKIELEKNVFIFDQNPDTLCFTIVPTTNCNMHCGYCFENINKNKEFVSNENIDSIIEFILNQIEKDKNVNKLYIKWFGGEPTLALEAIVKISKKLIDYCRNLGIAYSSIMVSNGLLLDEETALILKNECGIVKIQVTIDGFAEYYAKIRNVSIDTYNRVLYNIEHICDIVNVTIRINCSKDNLIDIRKLALYLLEEKKLSGKVEIYFARVKDFEFNDTNVESELRFEQFNREICMELYERGHIDSLLHSLPERNIFSCGNMQMNSFVIGPDLNLYRCDDYIGQKEFIIGNCSEGLFYNSVDCKYLNCRYLEKCRKCAILPICGGGCLHERLEQGKELDCEARILRFKTVIELHWLSKNNERREEV